MSKLSKWSPSDEKSWRDLKEFLKKELPIGKVTVRRVPLKGILGSCIKSGKQFVIKISSDKDFDFSIEILIHEWAHALSWDKPGSLNHSSAWGIAYAKCFHALMKHYSDVARKLALDRSY